VSDVFKKRFGDVIQLLVDTILTGTRLMEIAKT